ncbi:50S ribosomal protein L11 methyltransferase [Salsuginibacillus halophilus]|uniref:50S ribosomal protein L11 methyltransferase n=1 Tax=Salsuginibacillus halophilus TaxID=517424 RepID=UPI0031F3ED5A
MPLVWVEFAIETTQSAVEPISNILHEAGASGVVIEDAADFQANEKSTEDEVYEFKPEDYPAEGVRVKAYFPENETVKTVVENVKTSINELPRYDVELGANKITLAKVEEEDWAHAWKKYYKPVVVSDTMTIVPSWEVYEPRNTHEQVIELDPGMAFGTGTHPSTVLSLQLMEQYVTKNDEVIDIGTGSGILSIAAAKLGAKQVTALDVDEVAVYSACENIRLNDVNEQITVQQNDLLEAVGTQEADVVVANLLADIILRLTPDVHRVIRPGGCFISAGIIGRRKQDVIDAFEREGFQVLRTAEVEDWVAIAVQAPEA